MSKYKVCIDLIEDGEIVGSRLYTVPDALSVEDQFHDFSFGETIDSMIRSFEGEPVGSVQAKSGDNFAPGQSNIDDL